LQSATEILAKDVYCQYDGTCVPADTWSVVMFIGAIKASIEKVDSTQISEPWHSHWVTIKEINAKTMQTSKDYEEGRLTLAQANLAMRQWTADMETAIRRLETAIFGYLAGRMAEERHKLLEDMLDQIYEPEK
jgi:hypothetical protein